MSTTVTTQAELDAALAAGAESIIIGSSRGVWLTISDSATVRASGKATVEAYDSATVEAYGSATVRAYGSATVEAYDSATVEAYGSATVRAYGSATVRASDSATVEASDSATVRASGKATVRAYDSATVEASGKATVEASDSATVRAYGSATVRASDSATVRAGRYVAVHLHSQRVTLSGGVVIDMTAIDRADPATWCDLYGVDVRDGAAVVVKYVDAAFSAGHSHTLTAYRPGTVVEASDWNPRPRCGGGLHFGPTPRMAMESAFKHLGPDARWVLCEVDLSEAVGVDNKLKARCCRVLHEVDSRGNAIVPAAGEVSE